jgi:hypothetical protein
MNLREAAANALQMIRRLQGHDTRTKTFEVVWSPEVIEDLEEALNEDKTPKYEYIVVTPWEDRLKTKSGKPLKNITQEMIKAKMQEEIDDLRKAFLWSGCGDLTVAYNRGRKDERRAMLGRRQYANNEERAAVNWSIAWGKKGDFTTVTILKHRVDGFMEVVAVEHGPPIEPKEAA